MLPSPSLRNMDLQEFIEALCPLGEGSVLGKSPILWPMKAVLEHRSGRIRNFLKLRFMCRFWEGPSLALLSGFSPILLIMLKLFCRLIISTSLKPNTKAWSIASKSKLNREESQLFIKV